MDPYTSQIMIDRRLNELRADGAQARAARTARRATTGTSLRSRVMSLAFRWRARRVETPATSHDRRPSVSRPA